MMYSTPDLFYFIWTFNFRKYQKYVCIYCLVYIPIIKQKVMQYYESNTSPKININIFK